MDVEGIPLTIIGAFQANTVIITIESGTHKSVLFEKIVSRSLSYEEPVPEDIENKYGWKIDKFKSNVTRTNVAMRLGLAPEAHGNDEDDERPDVRPA